MADPFTPKFVDLVRNYSTTTGTGNFVLSTAVSGFTSFASAVQAGDTFYYSAIGVDKPAEREVGRGAMQANGTIARSPIGGSPTNFTSGSKTVALIAAAEWFTNIQLAAASGGSGGAPPELAATRTALAAMAPQFPVLLYEGGREGAFVFNSSNLAAKVAADPQQGLYVARSSDPTGATGAWVRKFTGAKVPEWFGAVGDGTTDDKVALQAWLDSGGWLFGTGSLAPFRSSSKLVIRRNVVLDGACMDGSSAAAPHTPTPQFKIKFDAGVSGLEVQPERSSGAFGGGGAP
jgi:hypothetical protein